MLRSSLSFANPPLECFDRFLARVQSLRTISGFSTPNSVRSELRSEFTGSHGQRQDNLTGLRAFPWTMADKRLATTCSKRKRPTNENISSPPSSPTFPPSHGDHVSLGLATCGPPPKLFHRVRNQRSILALVIAESEIYAGTQGGDILVRYLYTLRVRG